MSPQTAHVNVPDLLDLGLAPESTSFGEQLPPCSMKSPVKEGELALIETIADEPFEGVGCL
jgi:hypothetical protein